MFLIIRPHQNAPNIYQVFYTKYLIGKSLHNMAPIYLSTFILITYIFQLKRTAR